MIHKDLSEGRKVGMLVMVVVVALIHCVSVMDSKSEVLTSLEYYHSTFSHLVLMLHHQLEWSDEWVVLSLADCVLSTLV